MIKVMIVEDEPPIANALAKLITKLNNAFEIAGFAENGKEAIENYVKWKPDLIFTDIKMPIMDGFGFLEYLKSNSETPVVYILSGYEDFNYARQAIQYNVKGYLLKPIARKELEEILQEARRDFEVREKEKKERMLRQNLTGSETQIQKGDCFVGICCFGSYPMDSDDEMLPGIGELAGLDIDKMVQNTAGGCSTWVFNSDNSVEKVIILEGKDTAKDVYKTIFRMLNTKCSIPVTVITHQTGISLTSIGSMCRILRGRLHQNLIFGESHYFEHGSENGRREYGFSGNELQELREGILNADRTGADRTLKTFFEICEKRHMTQRSLSKYLNIIMGYFYEKYPVVQTREFEVENILANAVRYDELYTEIVHFLDILCEADGMSEIINPLAQSVRDYLDQHYNEVITNSSLSEKFGFVSAYLSRVFKNQYGITPSSYLLNVRMEHAKRILREHPEYLIKEVAEMVGYTDQYYFSKVFRKETSVWPKDYKRKG